MLPLTSRDRHALGPDPAEQRPQLPGVDDRLRRECIETGGDEVLGGVVREEGEDRAAGRARVERVRPAELHRHLDLLRALVLVQVDPRALDELGQRRGLPRDVAQPAQHVARRPPQVVVAQRADTDGDRGRAEPVGPRHGVDLDEAARCQRLQDSVHHRLAQPELPGDLADADRRRTPGEQQQHIRDAGSGLRPGAERLDPAPRAARRPLGHGSSYRNVLIRAPTARLPIRQGVDRTAQDL